MAPPDPENQITFWADHRPVMKNGDYTIEITQDIGTQDDTTTMPHKAPPQKIPDNTTFKATRNFSVLGPRFSLDPQEIESVFPPEGSLGEHSNVLPHIVFKRATLPWERSAASSGGKDDPPWLALLVFHDYDGPPLVQETSKPQTFSLQTVSLTDLGFPPRVMDDLWGKPSSKIIGQFNTDLSPEYGQHGDDLVQLITVRADFLRSVVPSRDELKWLTHVRQGTNSHGDATEPCAVLFANRLPIPDEHTTVHLVSLEEMYANDSNGAFRYADQKQFKDDTLISLVSLKSWRFACVSEDHDFKKLLQNLDSSPIWLPTKGPHTASEKYFKQGLAPFAHFMRQGNRSVSWYRGPLLPGENPGADPELPAANADSLVRYYKDIGMFDVSYAAAWELGRLLALQNKGVSVALFNWKRGHAQQQQNAENLLRHHPHLPRSSDPPELDLPDSVHTWFTQLSLLNGVPFNYLVPDQNMLPSESIRFFQVDPVWVECLLDGAFAVGRVLASDFPRDQGLKTASTAPAATSEHEKLSGFLLRSSVVSGYPHLLVDGYVFVTDNNAVLFNQISTLGIPGELRNKFRDKGLTLPDKLMIEETNGSNWRITDPETSQIKETNGMSWKITDQENHQFNYKVSYSENQIAIKLRLLRMDRLSSSVLLCLFAGKIERVDLHQKPESMHFGLDKPDTDNGRPDYYKKLRDLAGRPEKQEVPSVDWRDKGKRVVDIGTFQRTVKTKLKENDADWNDANWNVAQFALEMIEGAEKVQFRLKDP